MSDHLGVGVGAEFRALAFELVPQLAEILDDAVVDHGEAVGGMGVGVAFGRPAVGCPTGVADADGAGERLARESRFEIAQLALGMPAGKASVFQGGDAGRVISSVFEPLERVDERARDRPTSENAHNSAHGERPPPLLDRSDYNPDDDVSAVNAEREINIRLNF
jgi:hypothetical protein